MLQQTKIKPRVFVTFSIVIAIAIITGGQEPGGFHVN